MKSSSLYALISGLVLLVYGLYLLIFKDAVTNKEIIGYLFTGFAYIGYRFDMLEGK